MIIVGELINASRKAIKEAIEAKNDKAIKQVAKDQSEAGANYLARIYLTTLQPIPVLAGRIFDVISSQR